jgi:hypothetical protein
VAFTSRSQGGLREGRNRRDKGAIVGLSGWLFADLLLGVAVVFLVGSEKPSNLGIADRNRPSVRLEAVDNVQANPDIWSVNDKPFKVEVVFSEKVRNFEATDLQFTGEASGWIGQIIEPKEPNAVAERFIINIVPAQNLAAGEFSIFIPEKAAFSEKNSSGNSSFKKPFKVVKCFEYKGINPASLQKVTISGGYLKDTESLIAALQKELNDPIRQREQIGFLILFGGGKDGSILAERSGEKIRGSLASLGLVPKASSDEGDSGSCGVPVSENDFPILFYRDDGLPASDLKLNIYYMNK